MFGDSARKLRVERGETLRQFRAKAGLDPAYVSRVERGLLAPPQDQEKLEHYATALGLNRVAIPGHGAWTWPRRQLGDCPTTSSTTNNC